MFLDKLATNDGMDLLLHRNWDIFTKAISHRQTAIGIEAVAVKPPSLQGWQ